MRGSEEIRLPPNNIEETNDDAIMQVRYNFIRCIEFFDSWN